MYHRHLADDNNLIKSSDYNHIKYMMYESYSITFAYDCFKKKKKSNKSHAQIDWTFFFVQKLN